MKSKKAISLHLPDRPLIAGHKELIEICLNVPNPIHIVSTVATFKGRCRSSFGGQESIHSLVSEKLHIPFSAILLPTSKGIDVIPEGNHRLPIFVDIPHYLPGTFNGKFGAIVYRIHIKLKVCRLSNDDEGTLECDKIIDILSRVPLHQQPTFCRPVKIDRHVSKKVFFRNRLDANIHIEIDKAAYIVGQHILMSGEVKNNHLSNNIKHIVMELRQHILYANGDSTRSDSRMITKLIMGSCEPNAVFPIHHSLQIPIDCYPSLCWNGNPIQVSYELIIKQQGSFEIGIPVFIGNSNSASSYCRSITQQPESTCADSSSPYYYVPPSHYSGYSQFSEPPPYSATQRSFFAPKIHTTKSPFRQFEPAHSFYNHPKFDINYNHFNIERHSPPVERFLKIEEIE